MVSENEEAIVRCETTAGSFSMKFYRVSLSQVLACRAACADRTKNKYLPSPTFTYLLTLFINM